MNTPIIVCALGSYLAGGIPTGYILARRLKGIDIREHGSGNPGAANVYRTVGAGAGIATLAFDALKGFLPVAAARNFFPDRYDLMVLCGSCAIVGHVWTVFLGFRGGKGVATSAGVFAGLLPGPALLTLAVFLVGAGLSGHISVGSLAAAGTLPLFALALGSPRPLTLLAFAAGALIVFRHLPNLKRLTKGEEPKFRWKKTIEN